MKEELILVDNAGASLDLKWLAPTGGATLRQHCKRVRLQKDGGWGCIEIQLNTGREMR